MITTWEKTFCKCPAVKLIQNSELASSELARVYIHTYITYSGWVQNVYIH
jgi:hypothetical protein